jgi:SAM-dependent MidA family methyltransferase
MISQIIQHQIQQSPQQRITFAEFMDLALYHPQQGYYATGRVNIGDRGDFFTSPHLGADFGELLAKKFVELWETMGRPSPFYLVEMGAGQGILAADILRYLQQNYPLFFGDLDYSIVEKSEGLKQQQQKSLAAYPALAAKVSWKDWADIPEASLVGCCFSNELVDAFPVHLFTIAQGQLQEIYVSWQQERFQEAIGEISTPRLADYWQLIGMETQDLAEGYRSEINLAALDWLTTVAGKLQRGYLVTIDYGYKSNSGSPRQNYYSPSRDQGTLQCYYRHQHHNDPYMHLGEQDITAHVNFTALEKQGELLGLELESFTKQGLFLMELGLGDRLVNLTNLGSSSNLDSNLGSNLKPMALENNIASTQTVINTMQRRQALHQLIEPSGLGGFGVLIQSKNLREHL